MNFLGYFEQIAGIPHCSFESAKLGEFLLEFAKERGYSVHMDEFGNIHAQKGEPKICLQAHYDMVCVGSAPKIELIKDTEFLSARNSSLGADNGIGVAIIMQMMDEFSNLEVLFTNNEEVGLIGANGFAGDICAPYLLNLDSERDDEVIIGCAGGLNVVLSKEIALKECKNEGIYELCVEGLPGGHSGIEIAKNIPNALLELIHYINKNGAKIISINGGERNNAIPVSAKALVLSKTALNDENFVRAKRLENGEFLRLKDAKKIANFLCSLPHGVLSWNSELNMPKTSINYAIVRQSEPNSGKITLEIELYGRSSDENELERLGMKIAALASLSEFKVHFNERSLPWEPENSSFSEHVLKVLQKHRPNASIKAIHAGLECGALQAKMRGKGRALQACSIGPNIDGAHTIHERCEIKSAQMILEVVREILLEF